jgi:hypothetical protein
MTTFLFSLMLAAPAEQAPEPPAPPAAVLPDAPVAAAPARFEAKGASVIVSVGGQSCKTPCMLDLPPGAYTLRWFGDGQWGDQKEIIVNAGGGTFRINPSSKALFGLGIVGIPVGGFIGSIGFLTGLILAITADQNGLSWFMAISVPSLVVGTFLIAGGIYWICANLPGSAPFNPKEKVSFQIAPMKNGGIGALTIRF